MWGGNSQTYGEDPVQVFPYHIRIRGPPSPTTAAGDRGLWFCKPFYTGDQEGGVIMATWPELQLTLQELQAAAAPSVTAINWDDLSLTMEYNSGSIYSKNPSLRMPLVKGSPYISAEVPLPAVPIIRGPGNGGGVLTSVTQVTPTKLKVLVGGVPGGEGSHTFLVWGSKPFSYTLSGGSIRIQETAAAAAGKFSGRIRLAWAPHAGQPGAAAIEAMLDQYVDAIPTGGSVKAWSNLAAGTTSYSLSWSTQSLSGAASPLTKPLMLALPHHIDTLAAPASAAAALEGAAVAPDQAAAVGAVSFPLGVATAGFGSSAGLGSIGVYTSQPPQGSGRNPLDYGAYIMTVRGPQVPVVGSCWVLQEQVVPLLTETQAAANLRNTAWRSEIEQTLLADVPLVLPPASGNPFASWPGGWPWKGLMNLDAYFGGSEMQAMARLIHIAKALEETAPAAGSNFGPSAAAAAASVTNALRLLLQRKLTLPCTADGANPGALCYDNVLKTVTTVRALRAGDDGVDFFSRTGTDHHFHYGYWVAAAAAVASQNPAWYRTYLAPAVKALVRDYANNDKADPLFPFARHKDWYMGHSWAAGLQLSFDGKNQESSSEAVNAYLAIAELGKATGDAVLEGWGQLLLVNEVTAARKYSQSYAGNDIYRQVTGSSNNGVTRTKVATILFAAKASTFNWFDPDILTRHGIQWMPFTPAGSNALLPAGWLQESVPLVQAGTKMATNRWWSWSDQGGGAVLGWRVLLAMAQSMVPGQQAAAWDALNALPIDGSEGFALCGTIGRLTRTAAKWWVATRSTA